MYAVIKTGGKQYQVREGDKIRVEKLSSEVGSEISLDEVLLVGDEDKNIFGTPFVEGAKVVAKVLFAGRGKKIRIFKMNRRKGYRKTQGHRQSFTELEISKISVG